MIKIIHQNIKSQGRTAENLLFNLEFSVWNLLFMVVMSVQFAIDGSGIATENRNDVASSILKMIFLLRECEGKPHDTEYFGDDSDDTILWELQRWIEVVRIKWKICLICDNSNYLYNILALLIKPV